MTEVCWYTFIFGLFQFTNAVDKVHLTLTNVHCDTYISYVQTDTHLKYHPYIVKLNKCAGRDGNSLNFGCVPKTYDEINVYVRDLGSQSAETLILKNATSCEEKCLLNDTSCNSYQSFDEDRCQCDCIQKNPPPSCQSPFRWDWEQCGCICPVDHKTKICEKRKSFNKEYCSCMCKERFHRKCEKLSKSLDLDTCKCFEDPGVGHGTGKDPSKSGVDVAVVVIIVIAEFFIIVLLYYFYKRFCRDPKTYFRSYCSTEKDAEISKVDDHKLMKRESLIQ